jgi:hypothetical protein
MDVFSTSGHALKLHILPQLQSQTYTFGIVASAILGWIMCGSWWIKEW